MNNKTRVLLGAASAVGAAVLAGRMAGRTAYSFRDKSILITGGSRGLGLTMARLFAEEGARLTIVGRNAQTLVAAHRDLTALGGTVITVTCDVRDQEQVRRAVDAAVEAYGGIDVVVNDAGIMQVGPLEHMRLDDFRDAMATHAWGPLYMTLAALPHMKQQGFGRIVNISSIGGRIAVPHMLPYTMSKFALSGLSDGMRAELRKDGIFVTSVYPGLMRTGSHVNAYFKGNNESEFAWFASMAGMPLFSMDADRAARQIVEACRRGRPELIITTQARLAVMMNGIFPNIMARVMALMTRALPKPSETHTETRTGWESSSRWAPSILTKMADEAIEENNEYPAAS